jgi:Bacterial cellulose synthase subunit
MKTLRGPALHFACLLLLGTPASGQQIPVPRPGGPAPTSAPTATPSPTPKSLQDTPAPSVPKGSRLSDFADMLLASEDPLQVNLVFPDVDGEIGEQHLVRGAAVAQALALRAGYRPLTFSYSRQPLDEAMNVMIGSVEALRLYLPAEVAAKTTHSLLYLLKLADSGGRPALVVSGVTPAAVDEAILALGFANEKLPDSDAAFIRGVELPSSAPFMRRSPIFPGTTLSFQQLQTGRSALRLGPDGAIVLSLFMSAMVAIPTDAKIQIDLHFFLRQRAFSGNKDLAVLLNGEPATQLSPSDISSAATEGLAGAISIPVNKFLPGKNEIVFQPDGMVGRYAAPDTFAVYGDSGIAFPRLDGQVPLPDLRTTCRTLFPFVGQPDGSEISVLVTSTDRSTTQATWTFLAKLAQEANTLLYNASVSFKNLSPRQHQIIIGLPEHLPPEYRNGIAESWLKSSQQRKTDKAADLRPVAPTRNLQYFLSEQAKRIFPTPTPAPSQKKGEDAPDLRSACLTSVPNPSTTGRWTLILSAIDGATLEKRTHELIQPAFWDRIAGSAILWNSNPEAMRRFMPGAEVKQATFEDRDVQLPLGEKMSRNLWIVLCAVLFVVLVVLTVSLLGKFDGAVEARKHKSSLLDDRD